MSRLKPSLIDWRTIRPGGARWRYSILRSRLSSAFAPAAIGWKSTRRPTSGWVMTISRSQLLVRRYRLTAPLGSHAKDRKLQGPEVLLLAR